MKRKRTSLTRLCSYCDCRIKFVAKAVGLMFCPGCGATTSFFVRGAETTASRQAAGNRRMGGRAP